MKGIKNGLVVLLFSLLSGVAAADYPVSLRIVQPTSSGGVVLLSESGWGLTIKMVVNYDDILGYAKDYNYPNKGEFGFIVFDDPDGCPWMDDADWREGNGGLPPSGCEEFTEILEEAPWIIVNAEEDETYLEFRADVDESGMPDTTGDADAHLALVDSAGGTGPEFESDFGAGDCVPLTDDSDCTKMGPDTGGEVTDGYGIGADDDIAGLFLYSEDGIGLVFDTPDFELADSDGVHNLAGLVNSVTYDLSNLSQGKGEGKGNDEDKDKNKNKKADNNGVKEEARVWAHVNMPRQVVRNAIQYDACTGDMTLCDGGGLWRIDGGSSEAPPVFFDRPDAAAIWLLEDSTFTVHAFLVSGDAPGMLFDANGDGDYRDDAELAGYTVLSNLDSIDLIQLSDTKCWGGGGNSMYKDLDMNGEATVPIACPTGPGGLERPPR